MPRCKDPSKVERGPKLNEPVCIGEEVKIAVHLALQRFRLDPTQKEFSLPSSLTATERAYVHRKCSELGCLKTFSRGSGQNRYITITKVEDGKQSDLKPCTFNLVNCGQQVSNLLHKFPVTAKEKQELTDNSKKIHGTNEAYRDKGSFGRLTSSMPQIPSKRGHSDLTAFRESLPVYKIRSDIIDGINQNQVMLIAGETGSGKTTQVPQLMLDDCFDRKVPCRMLCTQPRRIAALSIAERVAAERGERIGHTVGYQIRLESKISPKTVLTFCTTGVLLRTLMGGEACLNSLTHIFVDEVHERDRFTDFILLCLKEALPQHPNLRLVLMSATLNMDLFSSYFDNCPVVCVPGNLHPVEEFFLEDILKWTNYSNKKMEKALKERNENPHINQEELNAWCSRKLKVVSPPASASEDEDLTTESEYTELGEECDELEPWVIEEMDRLLQEIWCTGSDEQFHQVLHLISSEDISVDYAQIDTKITPLMIAAGRGFFRVVEHLLNLCANANLKSSNGWTAIDFARNLNQDDVVELLEAHCASLPVLPSVGDDVLELVSPEDRQLLTLYQQSFDDEKVDIKLVTAILFKIYTSGEEGAILTFLPGYDDIISLKFSITDDPRFDSNRYVIYTLHSSLQHSDQKRVFKVPPKGVRKIILSTNIAETSVTINDVVFVVDCGKVKEKTFDALSSLTMLRSNWISKASALQRKGRAGRCQPGTCYHLFSRPRYVHLQDYQTPEILRLPLQELCLHTKLLAASHVPIAEFLSKCPQGPPQLVIKNAVEVLKQIDALDSHEDMTELGQHLSDLPIEPRLGKMILYSIVLKCLDPVLTIVCTLSFKDPFVLPHLPSERRAVMAKRRKFAEDTMSDHMVLLRAFQSWQKARTEGWERAFCEKNYISSATMEMLVGMRMQILGQLRASGFLRARGHGDIRDLNTNSENWALVKACLVAGTYPNIIQKREQTYLSTSKEPNVRLHNSSVLVPTSSATNFNTLKSWKKALKTIPSDWLIYEEMTRMNKFSMAKCVSAVSAPAVFLFAGPSKLSPDSVKEKIGQIHDTDDEDMLPEVNRITYPYVKLDDWLTFRMDSSEVTELAAHLRMKWHSLFLSRMKHPAKPWSQAEEAIQQVIIMLLGNAEKQIGLSNPVGVGQRPRPMMEAMVGGNFDDYYHQGGAGGHPPQHFQQHFQQHQQPYPRGGNSSNGRVYNNQVRRNVQPNSSRSYRKGEAQGSMANHVDFSKSATLLQEATNAVAKDPEPGLDSETPSSFYFVMKCHNQRHLENSYAMSVWATSIVNEAKMNKAFQTGKPVYLIFSIQGSGHFQGFGKMASPIGNEKPPEFVAPGWTGIFRVDWIKRANLPFQFTQHLTNPWNENRKVQVSRDGQEIQPNVGAALTKLWDRYPSQSKHSHMGWKGQHKTYQQPRHRGQSGQQPTQIMKKEQKGETVTGDSNSAGKNKNQSEQAETVQSSDTTHSNGSKSASASCKGQLVIKTSPSKEPTKQGATGSPSHQAGSPSPQAGSPGTPKLQNSPSGANTSPVVILQRSSTESSTTD